MESSSVLSKDKLIRIVAEDLEYLREEWDENIDEPSLRRSSSVLRRLLVQNDLQKAWKKAGFTKEPQVPTLSLDFLLSKIPLERILFASIGGHISKQSDGNLVGAKNIHAVLDMTRAEQIAVSSDDQKEEFLHLRSFIEQTCIIVNGEQIRRRVLVKYVANKLGGGHYDASRSSNKEEGRLFSLLDWASQAVQIADKNAIYHELVSTGQSLARSKDITDFCNKVINN